MKQQNGSEEVYRVAFDSANAELNEILVGFEQLRLRKERIEKVVNALKPLLGLDEQVAVPSQHEEEQSFEAEHEAAEGELVHEGAEGSGDPFQRRIDLALREGTNGQGVRKFARQFHR